MTATIHRLDPFQDAIDTIADPASTWDDIDQACTALERSRHLYHQTVAAEARRVMAAAAVAEFNADHADPVGADQVKATLQAMERNLDRATKVVILGCAAIAAVCWARGLL